MKTLRYGPCAVGLLLVQMMVGCGSMTFDITQTLPTIAVQGGGVMAGQPISVLPTHDVAAQDVGPADVAYLESLSLTATDDSGNPSNFDFVTEIHVLVSAPGLPIVEVANLVQVPTGSSTLNLNVLPNVNLVSYLSGGCTIQTEAFGTYPSQDVNIGGQLDAAVGI